MITICLWGGYNNVINHPWLGMVYTKTYQLSMVMTGGWFMIVIPCYTHMSKFEMIRYPIVFVWSLKAKKKCHMILDLLDARNITWLTFWREALQKWKTWPIGFFPSLTIFLSKVNMSQKGSFSVFVSRFSSTFFHWFGKIRWVKPHQNPLWNGW